MSDRFCLPLFLRRSTAIIGLAMVAWSTLPDMATAKPKQPETCIDKWRACIKRCEKRYPGDVGQIYGCSVRTCDKQRKNCDQAEENKDSKRNQSVRDETALPYNAVKDKNPLTDQNRAPKQPGILDNTPGLPPPSPGATGNAGPRAVPTTNAPVTGAPAATGPHVRVPPSVGGSINAPSQSPRTPPPIIR